MWVPGVHLWKLSSTKRPKPNAPSSIQRFDLSSLHLINAHTHAHLFFVQVCQIQPWKSETSREGENVRNSSCFASLLLLSVFVSVFSSCCSRVRLVECPRRHRGKERETDSFMFLDHFFSALNLYSWFLSSCSVRVWNTCVWVCINPSNWNALRLVCSLHGRERPISIDGRLRIALLSQSLSSRRLKINVLFSLQR